MPNGLCFSLFIELYSDSSPLFLFGRSVMAMIGGSTFCGAVTHTLSSAIVLLEMTGDVTFCVHSMLATSIAISLSRQLTESIFEKIIRLRGLPFLFALRYMPKPVYARDFMSRSIVPRLLLVYAFVRKLVMLCFCCSDSS